MRKLVLICLPLWFCSCISEISELSHFPIEDLQSHFKTNDVSISIDYTYDSQESSRKNIIAHINNSPLINMEDYFSEFAASTAALMIYNNLTAELLSNYDKIIISIGYSNNNVDGFEYLVFDIGNAKEGYNLVDTFFSSVLTKDVDKAITFFDKESIEKSSSVDVVKESFQRRFVTDDLLNNYELMGYHIEGNVVAVIVKCLFESKSTIFYNITFDKDKPNSLNGISVASLPSSLKFKTK